MADFETVSAYLVLDTSSPTMLRFKDGTVAGGLAASNIYLKVKAGPKRFMSHRAIAMLKYGKDIPEGLVVDHIDGNKLNNHPDNLQIITSAGNSQKSVSRAAAVGFSWHAGRKCWRVRIRRPGRRTQVDVGNFKCMLDARAAYLRKCKEYAA